MEILALLLSFIFIAWFQIQTSRAEKDRFREFVKAVKSENVAEFAQLTNEEALPEQEPNDELMELDQIEPERLLTLIKGD